MKTTISKLFLFTMVIFMFVGCATTGPKYSEFAPTISNLAPDTGRIYIYRPSSLGAAVQPNVKLNEEVIGEAISWGFFYVDRKPGNYEILTSTEVDRKLSLILDKGQTRYVRLNISMGFFVGHVYPELVENEEGQKEIEDCRYIGAKK
jgi:hypothetical protein